MSLCHYLPGSQNAAGYIDQLDPEIFPFVSYEGYADRYPAQTVLKLPGSFYQELREASRALFHIFTKASQVFQKCPDKFMALMDMPEKLRPFLDVPNKMDCPTYLSRFDFVLDKNGQFKCVELNADTPCAVVEAFYANKIACNAYSENDPNSESYRELLDWLKKIFIVNLNNSCH